MGERVTIEIYREWASSGGVKQTVGNGYNELQMGKGWVSE